eukprot:Skav218451  [mRNA]  locus=scaffold538:159999:160838:+ [translate_table: standard]
MASAPIKSIEDTLSILLEKEEKNTGKKPHWSKKLKLENLLLRQELNKMTDLLTKTVVAGYGGQEGGGQGSGGQDDFPDRDPDDFSNDEDDEGDGSTPPSDDEEDFIAKDTFIIYIVKGFDNRKVLSISVKKQWRLNYIKFFITAKWGIPPNFQHFVSFKGNDLYGNLTVQENNIQPFQSIRLTLSLKGGASASSRVRKTIGKKQERVKTHQDDKAIFEQAFNTSLLVNTAPTFSLEVAVKDMKLDSLRKLKHYMFKDKFVHFHLLLVFYHLMLCVYDVF